MIKLNIAHYRQYCTLLAFCISLLFLSSCAVQSTNSPGTRIEMQAANFLNPDIFGKAKPIEVSIYQLSSTDAFTHASFNALWQNDSKILGASLVDKEQFELRPSEQRTITIPYFANATYLGIVAGYRELDKATWRKVIHLSKKDHKLPVRLNLSSEGINIPGESHYFW